MSGTGLLAVSYHFWRYAVEAEAYMPALLPITTLFYLVMQPANYKMSLPMAVFSALLAGAAVLIYKPNMIPIAFLLLLLFTHPKNRLQAVGIGTLAALMIAVGYYQVYRMGDNGQVNFVEYLLTGTQSQHRVDWNVVKLAAVMGSLVLAPNFIYGFPVAQRFLRQSFYEQYLQDDIFAASQFPLAVYAALFTLLICVALFALLMAHSMRAKGFRAIVQTPQLIVTGWLLTYLVLLVIQLDSFSPEPLVPLLVPVVYLVTVLLFDPAANRPALPLAFVAAVFCHNMLGGFSIVYSSKTEWLRCQQEWLMRNARKDDVIVIHGPVVTRNKLAYYTTARVIASSVFHEPYFAVADTVSSAGRIFLLADLPHINRPGYQPTGDCEGYLYEVRR